MPEPANTQQTLQQLMQRSNLITHACCFLLKALVLEKSTSTVRTVSGTGLSGSPAFRVTHPRSDRRMFRTNCDLHTNAKLRCSMAGKRVYIGWRRKRSRSQNRHSLENLTALRPRCRLHTAVPTTDFSSRCWIMISDGSM